MSTLLESAQRQDACGACEGGRPRITEAAPSAYGYPLLIKHLLLTPLRHAPDQEIVYRDLVRYDYRTLAQRIGRLANGLASLGVGPGDTVGVLDWDSHRYLECYFAIPSMGAVLHTVNIRLSPEQILYTINHAEDDVLLVHADFLPLVEGIRDRIERVRKIVVLIDGGDVPETPLEIAAEYEALLASLVRRTTTSPTSTRTPAPRPSTPPARPACRRACTSATASWCCIRWRGRGLRQFGRAGPAPPGRRVHADHADVPRPRLGAAVHRDHAGHQAGLSRPLRPGDAAQADRDGEGDLLPLRPDPAAHAADGPASARRRPQRLEGGHRRLGPAQGTCPGRARAGHRRLQRLRHVRDLSRPHPGAAHPRDARGRRPTSRSRSGPRRACRYPWSTCASSTPR